MQSEGGATAIDQFARLRDRFRRERAGRIVPLQFVGDYADLLEAGVVASSPSSDKQLPSYPLDLRNFTDETVNRVTSFYHDRWISLVRLIFNPLPPAPGHRQPNALSAAEVAATPRPIPVADEPRHEEIEREYLVRFFSDELAYPAMMIDGTRRVDPRPADSNQAAADICNRLDALNGIMARRLYDDHEPPPRLPHNRCGPR